MSDSITYSGEGSPIYEVSDFNESIYNFEDRLVRFAGEIKLWYRKLDKTDENKYYGH